MKGKKFKGLVCFVAVFVVIFIVISGLLYFYFGKTEVEEIREDLLSLNYSQGEIPNYFWQNNLVVELSKRGFKELYDEGYFEDEIFYTASYSKVEEEVSLKQRENVVLNIWGIGKNGMVFYYKISQVVPLKQKIREISTNIGSYMIRVDIVKDPDTGFFHDCLVYVAVILFFILLILFCRRKRYRITGNVRW